MCSIQPTDLWSKCHMASPQLCDNVSTNMSGPPSTDGPPSTNDPASTDSPVNSDGSAGTSGSSNTATDHSNGKPLGKFYN